MYQLSDNDLDRLSKEAADQVDPELSVSGWDNLERRLNKELPQSKKDRRRFLFLLLLIGLVSGTGLVWTLGNGKEPAASITTIQEPATSTSTVEKPATPVTNLKRTDADAQINQPGSAVNPEASADPAITAQKAPQPLTEEKLPNESAQPNHAGQAIRDRLSGSLTDKDTRKNPVENKTTLPVSGGLSRKHSLPGDRSGNTIPSALTTDKNSWTASKKSAENKERIGKNNKTRNNKSMDVKGHDDSSSPDDIDVANQNIAQNSERKKNNLTAKAQNDTGDPSTLKESAAVVPVKEADSQIVSNNDDAQRNLKQLSEATDSDSLSAGKSATAKKAKKKTQRQGFFDIGIMAGPDLTTVKYHFTDQPGFNAGFQAGYHISDRWSFHSGLIYTKKNYTAKGKDFNPPKTYWTNNVYLHEVEGSCYMLDIPLNVRYNILSGTRRKVFASTGLSTYLMNKETYQYDYTLNGVSTNARWTNKKNSAFVFSVLNLSAGFEKIIDKRFSLQAEPYFKAPLKGLGFGNMQMSSYGIYFSLLYRP